MTTITTIFSHLMNRFFLALILSYAILLIMIIMIFRAVNNDSIINMVFTIAGYTYGPLLGLFAFGLFTKIKIKDAWVPLVVIIAPV